MPNLMTNVLTELRYVFGATAAVAVLTLLAGWLTRRSQNFNFLTNVLLSGVVIVVNVLTFVAETQILGATDMAGDRLSFYLFLGGTALALLNPLIYRFVFGRTPKRRYHF